MLFILYTEIILKSPSSPLSLNSGTFSQRTKNKIQNTHNELIKNIAIIVLYTLNESSQLQKRFQ